MKESDFKDPILALEYAKEMWTILASRGYMNKKSAVRNMNKKYKSDLFPSANCPLCVYSYRYAGGCYACTALVDWRDKYSCGIRNSCVNSVYKKWEPAVNKSDRKKYARMMVKKFDRAIVRYIENY